MTTLCPSKLLRAAYRQRYVLLIALALPQLASAAAYMQRFVYGGDFVGANSANCNLLAPIYHNVAALSACETHKNQAQIGARLLLPRTRIKHIKATGVFARVIKFEQNSNNILADSDAANIFYSHQLASGLNFGVAMFTPYAFAYNLKYNGLDFSHSLDVNNLRLALAYKLSDNIFIGAGTDVYNFKAQHFYSLTPSNPIKIGGLSLNKFSMDAKLRARDIGFNLGALFILNNGATRWGFNYQSAVKAKLQGVGTLRTTTPNTLEFIADMPVGLPPIISAAMQQQLGKWQLGVQLAYNDWGALGSDNYLLTNDLGDNMLLSTAADQIIESYTKQQSLLRATLALSFNVNYQINANYSVGMGYSAEDSPVETKTNQLPFSAQHWLHLGAAYRHKTWSLTGGFAYMRKVDHQFNTGINIGPLGTGKIAANIASGYVIAGFMLGYFF